MTRRNFLKYSLFSTLSVSPLFADGNKLKIILPTKKLKYYHLKGKQKGGRVLIIGGIHGNEIGAYKAADLLIDNDLKKGELLIIPRSNFTSILANVRGYNGDMNRKFDYISKKDPDYYYVESLKEIILNYKPDVVISMHDGFGFASKYKRAWGQSVVIDELKYKNFDLYTPAKFVLDNANKYLKYKLALINTKTFSGKIHPEQKKALTGWCLEHGIKAFCIEASKQLPSIKEKVYTHLTMLREFFKLYNIEFDGGNDRLVNNFDLALGDKPKLILDVNGKKITLKNRDVLKVKKGSIIKVVEIDGKRGDFIVPVGVNLNWSSFHFNNLTFNIKRDYKKIFSIDIRSV